MTIINAVGGAGGKATEPLLQERTVTPPSLPYIVGTEEGYDGLRQVTINPDANLVATNIRKDKTIFGVTGSFEGETIEGEPPLIVASEGGTSYWYSQLMPLEPVDMTNAVETSEYTHNNFSVSNIGNSFTGVRILTPGHADLQTYTVSGWASRTGMFANVNAFTNRAYTSLRREGSGGEAQVHYRGWGCGVILPVWLNRDSETGELWPWTDSQIAWFYNAMGGTETESVVMPSTTHLIRFTYEFTSNINGATSFPESSVSETKLDLLDYPFTLTAKVGWGTLDNGSLELWWCMQPLYLRCLE